MTDEEIKAAIVDMYQVELDNLSGDTLMEGPCNNDEDAYWRAKQLLANAKLTITWQEA